MQGEFWPGTGPPSGDGTTSAPSHHGHTGSGAATSSPGDSHARTSARQATAPASTENGLACGASSSESFAFYDRGTSSWRTWQLCLNGESAEFSETWPGAGMTRNGIAYRLTSSAPTIPGLEFS